MLLTPSPRQRTQTTQPGPQSYIINITDTAAPPSSISGVAVAARACDIAVRLNPITARASAGPFDITVPRTCGGSLEHLSRVTRLFEDGPVVILVDDYDHQLGRALDEVPDVVRG